MMTLHLLMAGTCLGALVWWPTDDAADAAILHVSSVAGMVAWGLLCMWL